MLQGFAEGRSYAEIAAHLHLAHASVKNYAHSAIKKLSARSQAHAVYLAVGAGLLDPRRRHGDHAGYAAHIYHGEEPCEACRKAERAYQQEKRRKARMTARSSEDKPQRHGDHGGYSAHLYRGEEPCEACREGESAYRKGLREARKTARSNAA